MIDLLRSFEYLSLSSLNIFLDFFIVLMFVLFLVTVTPIKLSPRALVRSRRSGHIVQPSMILSPDPDLLMPIRPSASRYGDEEGDGLMFSTLVKGYRHVLLFFIVILLPYSMNVPDSILKSSPGPKTL